MRGPRSIRLALVVLLTIGASSAPATPVLYNVNFTGGIEVFTQSAVPIGVEQPTASFDYDAANASAPFSNFIVQWDGLPYDLTAAANSPHISGPDPCLGGATGGAATFELLTACTGSDLTTNTVWEAFALNAPVGVNEFNIADEYDYTPYTCVTVGDPDCDSHPELRGGLVSISPASGPATAAEPGSWLLVGIGLCTAISGSLLSRRYRKPPGSPEHVPD